MTFITLSFVLVLLLSSIWAVPISIIDSSFLDILAIHNTLREIHGSPPLTWDLDMADFAQDWSDRCILQHSGVNYKQ